MRSMSPSDRHCATVTLEEVAAELERCIDDVIAHRAGAPLDVGSEPVRRIVSAAARLYARHVETAATTDPLREDVSPTEAVELACGLLRARDLNPFDLALWFSRAQ